MKVLTDYSPPELKLVYQVLQGQLQNHPDLLDSEILEDLQTYLQQQARSEGVDPTYHPAWAAWLRGVAPPAPPSGHPRGTLKLVED